MINPLIVDGILPFIFDTAAALVLKL